MKNIQLILLIILIASLIIIINFEISKTQFRGIIVGITVIVAGIYELEQYKYENS